MSRIGGLALLALGSTFLGRPEQARAQSADSTDRLLSSPSTFSFAPPINSSLLGVPPAGSGVAQFGVTSLGGTGGSILMNLGPIGTTGAQAFVAIAGGQSGTWHGIRASGEAITVGAEKTFADGTAVGLSETYGQNHVTVPASAGIGR